MKRTLISFGYAALTLALLFLTWQLVVLVECKLSG